MRKTMTGISTLVLAALAVASAPALAQGLPDLREARGLVYDPVAIEWEVIPHESLSPADQATINQISQIQPQPYFAAMAIDPEGGLATERTQLAANYHDEENARAAALAACGEGCIVVLVIRPAGWEPGRALQLSAQATEGLENEYRALRRRARVMAISPGTGQWGVGEDADAAIAACAAADCRPVVEG